MAAAGRGSQFLHLREQTRCFPSTNPDNNSHWIRLKVGFSRYTERCDQSNRLLYPVHSSIPFTARLPLSRGINVSNPSAATARKFWPRCQPKKESKQTLSNCPWSSALGLVHQTQIMNCSSRPKRYDACIWAFVSLRFLSST